MTRKPFLTICCIFLLLALSSWLDLKNTERRYWKLETAAASESEQALMLWRRRTILMKLPSVSAGGAIMTSSYFCTAQLGPAADIGTTTGSFSTIRVGTWTK